MPVASADPASLTKIREFFGYETAGDFKAHWIRLSVQDRNQIKQGFGDGTMTY